MLKIYFIGEVLNEQIVYIFHSSISLLNSRILDKFWKFDSNEKLEVSEL